jgi:hypothetical protein
MGLIFSTRPDRSWGLPSLLYNGYRVSFPGVKLPGRGVDHLPSSSTRVKERVQLYLYSPSGPSWPVLGRTGQVNASAYTGCSFRNLPGGNEEDCEFPLLV